MAIFEEVDELEPTLPSDPIKVKIEPPEFDGVTIDTQYTPSSSLLTWVAGSNWQADYYSQVLGSDSEPMPQALDKPAIYQQYRLIKNLALKVTQPLSFTQDPTTLTMTVSGSGITYPFVVPNLGDMFIANIGDGRRGIFTITRAQRATILRDSVYNVDWIMVSEVTTARMQDLEEKTIETLHYSPSSLISGCGPFITTTEVVRTESYADYHGELIKRYLTDFFSHEHSTLLVPDQLMKTYDHFVTRAFLMMVDSSEDNRVRRVRELNVMAAPVMKQPTLWDALLRQDPARLYGSTQKADLVSTREFRGQATLQAIGYTGISRLVYPIDAPTDVDSQYDASPGYRPAGIALREGRPRRPVDGPYLTQAERDAPYFKAIPADIADNFQPWEIPPTIHPVVKDDYYVFSEAFYLEQLAGQSKLEMLTWQVIRGEPLNYEQFDALLATVYEWDNLERYYYHPVVIALLKLAMR
jgi:hypothetical protein